MPMIDIAALNDQTFHDTRLRAELLEMLGEQAPVLLAAIDATSGAARSDVAHRLKGSALALAAQPLADAASAVETAPGEQALLAALHDAVRDTLAEARRLLATE